MKLVENIKVIVLGKYIYMYDYMYKFDFELVCLYFWNNKIFLLVFIFYMFLYKFIVGCWFYEIDCYLKGGIIYFYYMVYKFCDVNVKCYFIFFFYIN